MKIVLDPPHRSQLSLISVSYCHSCIGGGKLGTFYLILFVNLSNIFDCRKNRLVPYITPKVKQAAMRDLVEEQRNMDVISKPYLTTVSVAAYCNLHLFSVYYHTLSWNNLH